MRATNFVLGEVKGVLIGSKNTTIIISIQHRFKGKEKKGRKRGKDSEKGRFGFAAAP